MLQKIDSMHCRQKGHQVGKSMMRELYALPLCSIPKRHTIRDSCGDINYSSDKHPA